MPARQFKAHTETDDIDKNRSTGQTERCPGRAGSREGPAQILKVHGKWDHFRDLSRTRDSQTLDSHTSAGSDGREEFQLTLESRSVPALLTINRRNRRFELTVTSRLDARFGLFRTQSLQAGGTTGGQVRGGGSFCFLLSPAGATARTRTPAGQSQQGEQQQDDKWQPKLQQKLAVRSRIHQYRCTKSLGKLRQPEKSKTGLMEHFFTDKAVSRRLR